MNVCVYFLAFFEKINMVFQRFSNLGEQQNFLCLQFHFPLKTKLMKNYVGFLFIFFLVSKSLTMKILWFSNMVIYESFHFIGTYYQTFF